MTEIKKAKPKTLNQKAEAWAESNYSGYDEYGGIVHNELDVEKAWLAGYRAGKREAKTNEN